MDCNIPAIWNFIVYTNTKLTEIDERNFFQELGEKPSLLEDEVFIAEAVKVSEKILLSS